MPGDKAKCAVPASKKLAQVEPVLERGIRSAWKQFKEAGPIVARASLEL